MVSDVDDLRDVLEKPEAQLPSELITDRPPAKSVDALLDFLEAKSLELTSFWGSRAWLGLLEISPTASGAEISMLEGFPDFSSVGVDAADERNPLNLAFSANIFQSSALRFRT